LNARERDLFVTELRNELERTTESFDLSPKGDDLAVVAHHGLEDGAFRSRRRAADCCNGLLARLASRKETLNELAP
jgi:hypothetical protein